MILSIESSLPTFKAVTFHEGLNVLLSDKSETSTTKQTRNSAGKTSLVEIIHFLLGSDCDKDSLFRVPELISHTFKGRFRIGGEVFTVERGGAEPAKVFLLAGGDERTESHGFGTKGNGKEERSADTLWTGKASTGGALQRSRSE